MNHLERIKKYLQENKSITDNEARDLLGCNRLSEYVRQLRKNENWNIKSNWQKGKNRYGEKTHYVKYELED